MSKRLNPADAGTEQGARVLHLPFTVRRPASTVYRIAEEFGGCDISFLRETDEGSIIADFIEICIEQMKRKAMGISRLTAMIIASNGDSKHGDGISVSASGPIGGKYAGWITLWKDQRPHISPLVMTEFEFDSEDDAKAKMSELIRSIRSGGVSSLGEIPAEENQNDRRKEEPAEGG